MVIVSIIIGTIFALFYIYFVVPGFKIFNLKFKDVKGSVNIDLPQKDTYLLKIWGLEFPQGIYFNGDLLEPYSSRERGKIKELYFKIEAAGTSIFEIVSPLRYSLKIQNCRGYNDEVVVLFKSSRFLKNLHFKAGRFLAAAIIYCFIIFVIFRILSFLLQRFFSFSFEKEVLRFSFCFLPGFLFFLMIYLFSIFSDLKVIALRSSYFARISIFSVGIFLLPLVLFYVEKLRNRLVSLIRIWVDTSKIADKFIVLFIVMIMLNALLFFVEPKIEQLANIAYFALVIGVIIKFVRLVRAGKQENE